MAAEKNEEMTAISLTISGEKLDFGQDPSDSSTSIEAPVISQQEKTEEKEEKHEVKSDEDAVFRESKKRKTCVTALEKFTDDPPSLIRGFSFSFDTKISSIESTPKFGSFNLVPDLGFGPASTGEDNCDGVSLGLGLGLGFWDKEKCVEEKEKVVGSSLDGDERGI